MATKIRSSQQLYIDADLNFNSKKASSLLDGSLASDAATVGQMNTAIASAVSGVGNSIHAPVANLAAAKTIAAAGRADKMIMLIETLGLYHFDAESVATSDDILVIRPFDLATDADAGRWIKMSSVLNSHDLLSNILGNGTYHLSVAERNNLNNQSYTNTGDETATRIATIIAGTVEKTLPIAADIIPILDSASGFALKKLTFANLKTYLFALFTGDVTVNATGVTAIGANKVVNTQLAQMAANTIKGNNTGSAANAADLTIAQIKSMLGLTAANQATRTYRATPTGTVNGSNTDFTIAALIISGTEEVYKNGLLMNAGAGNDYTIAYGATTTITFLTAPSNTPFADVILVNYSS